MGADTIPRPSATYVIAASRPPQLLSQLPRSRMQEFHPGGGWKGARIEEFISEKGVY